MRFIYVVNGKSIALQERIDSVIEDQKVPLSLFRATLLNAIRKLHDGKEVDFLKLKTAIESSYEHYRKKARRSNKLIDYGDLCLSLIKEQIESPSDENLKRLINSTGYLPADKIGNLRMLITLLKRRIFDCDQITEIEKMIGRLNSLSGDIGDSKETYLNANPVKSDPLYNEAISNELIVKHTATMIPKQLSGIIYDHGAGTLTDLNFKIISCDVLPGGKHYVYYLKFRNLTIKCKVQNKQLKKGKTYVRHQSDSKQHCKTS